MKPWAADHDSAGSGGAAAIACTVDVVPAPLMPRALSASVVEAGAFGLNQLLRLASSLILTRVLLPEAFGIMAMLSLLLYGLHMMSDVGILQAVVRSPRGTDEGFLHTAFTIQAARGVSLWLVASALAWPLAWVFREPVLVWLVPIGALSAILDGLTSLRAYLLRRRMQALPIALLELLSQLVGVVVTVAAAARLELGVWSLVAGTLANTSVHTLGSHFLPDPHRDRLRWEPAARREIFSFGRWIFASSAVTFLAGRGDQLLLGRMLGASSLGLYNIASSLAEAPESLAQRFMSGVLYPLYARVFNERPDDMARVYYRSRAFFDASMQTALGGLYALAPWIIGLLYDARYQGAGLMLQLLSLRVALTLLAVPCESALTARGRGEFGFRANVVLAASVLGFLPVGYAMSGVHGVLWAMVASRAAALLTLWHGAREHGVLRLGRELVAPALFVAGYSLGKVFLWLLGAIGL
jgi:O-antigen/teichoic acid export membrane protein